MARLWGSVGMNEALERYYTRGFALVLCGEDLGDKRDGTPVRPGETQEQAAASLLEERHELDS